MTSGVRVYEASAKSSPAAGFEPFQTLGQDETVDTEGDGPSWVKKLLYLSGIRAPEDHRNWVSDIIHDTNARRRGFLLAIPNVVIVLIGAAASLALGDMIYAIFLICLAPALTLAGAFVGPIGRRRSRWLARRNDLATPYG